jgi:hypothetical protein
MKKNFNFIIYISVLLGISCSAKGQPIIKFDTSEVYVLSYFEYSGHPDSSSSNHYRYLMLKNNNNLTKLLKPGLTTYRYISPSKKKLLTRIENMIDDTFITNCIVEISSPYFARWMLFLNTHPPDSSTESKTIRKIITDSILSKKMFWENPDIADGRIVRELQLLGNSADKLKGGTYYMLLKMRISSIIIDDSKNDHRTQGRTPSFYFYSPRSGTITFSTQAPYIYCQLIRMKDDKNRTLLALPYQFEMLHPYKSKKITKWKKNYKVIL